MYYNKDINDIYKELDSSIDGLSDKEYLKRIKENGKNVLPEKENDSVFKLFFNNLSSPIEIVLLVTVFISFLVGERVDALVILFIILVDVLVGTYEDFKALKSASNLAKMIRVKSNVIRNGEEIQVYSEDIVVGDILKVDSGTKIAADARIIEAYNLQVDESVLTGESVAVSKNNKTIKDKASLGDRFNMLYAGTNVMTGRGIAIVVATGVNTEVGQIAKQVSMVEDEKSPLMIRMEKFSKQISLLMVIIAILSFFILLYKGYKLDTILLSVIALSVSAMPEGLSLAFTMALTITSNKMSRENVVVKKLNSVEALGSCTVIASDKTGTFTVNEQTAKKIVLSNSDVIDIDGVGYNTKGKVKYNSSNESKVKEIAYLGAINNEASFENASKGYIYYGDSIDIAFLVLGKKLNIDTSCDKVDSIPYESDKGYSAVFYKNNNKLYCTVKGSLERVMEFSKNNKNAASDNEKLSSDGYRVIAVASGEVKSTNVKDIKNLNYLGLVGFIDPIRVEVKDALKECRDAGIKVSMITGDHPLTSYAIAKELKLVSSKDEVTTGDLLEEAYNKGEDYFTEYVRGKKVFSRVTPIIKYRIVEAYKKMGEFVAVTGDGVNDASAIKTANIGIAMGSGTDVSKDIADMIILDDNFKSIVSGVREGRIAYSNIRKITLFLLSCGLAEVLFYLMSVIFGYPLPLVAIQLLWINIVTDGLQDIALSFENADYNIMRAKPRDTKELIFNKDLMMEVGAFGLTISVIVFITWKYLVDNNYDLLFSRSVVLMLMVLIQNIHVLNCRSERKSIFKVSILNNPLILLTICGSIILQLIVSQVPVLASLLNVSVLSINTIVLLFMISLIIIVVSEIYKIIYKKIKA